jgi:methyl-accepting chemotaxis protein
LEAFSQAIAADDTDFRFPEDACAQSDVLRALNHSIEMLDARVKAHEVLAEDALNLTASRDREANRRSKLEQKLVEIARLIDLYKAAADRVGDMVQDVQADSQALGGVFAGGSEDAQSASDLSADTQSKMSAAGDVLTQTAQSMAELEALSAQIDKMVGDIEDVSFRTNLLIWPRKWRRHQRLRRRRQRQNLPASQRLRPRRQRLCNRSGLILIRLIGW